MLLDEVITGFRIEYGEQFAQRLLELVFDESGSSSQAMDDEDSDEDGDDDGTDTDPDGDGWYQAVWDKGVLGQAMLHPKYYDVDND